MAKSIVLQANVEGSDLLRGGLTHTVLDAYWCAAGRVRVVDTWEVRNDPALVNILQDCPLRHGP